MKFHVITAEGSILIRHVESHCPILRQTVLPRRVALYVIIEGTILKAPSVMVDWHPCIGAAAAGPMLNSSVGPRELAGGRAVPFVHT